MHKFVGNPMIIDDRAAHSATEPGAAQLVQSNALALNRLSCCRTYNQNLHVPPYVVLHKVWEAVGARDPWVGSRAAPQLHIAHVRHLRRTLRPAYGSPCSTRRAHRRLIVILLLLRAPCQSPGAIMSRTALGWRQWIESRCR